MNTDLFNPMVDMAKSMVTSWAKSRYKGFVSSIVSVNLSCMVIPEVQIS